MSRTVRRKNYPVDKFYTHDYTFPYEGSWIRVWKKKEGKELKKALSLSSAVTMVIALLPQLGTIPVSGSVTVSKVLIVYSVSKKLLSTGRMKTTRS